ncbi:MAG: nucleoside deaminase [Alphaproteobacteria bacterium]|tara:strand:- start:4763 stop:5233 length:471 start_codon:yes stop_codon:yes gene_type:complete
MCDNTFMRRAITLATNNVTSGNGGPFGAVITREGVVIGEGTNQVTSFGDPTAHAEILAIRAACKNIGSHILDGCIIYTSCEPCPMCLSAIYWARIKFIYFGNRKSDAAAIGFDDAHIYQQIALPEGQRSIPTNQMLSEEAIISFQKWTQSEFKIEY